MSMITVIMPTFKQATFIPRAVASLLAQSLQDWELVIVDDGSPDQTLEAVQPYLDDPRIVYKRLPYNQGLGAALNSGLSAARSPLIAYLPSDDVFYARHLESLAACLEQEPGAVLVYAGVRHHYNRDAEGIIPGYPLQLVQAIHRRTEDRWVERDELESDNLGRLFWQRLEKRGNFVGTGELTCEWVNHPRQRHKLLQEPEGGLNPFRVYYGVKQPLRMHTTVGNRIDEVERYRAMRKRPDTPMAPDGLKILLVGELAYNAERVLALEERGHRLYGLWMPDPFWYNTVGPLPFGHVQDLDPANWQAEVERIQPDVIYALLNWQAVPFAHRVLTENPGIPFVWHYKEGPFISLEKGHWAELLELYQYSDGQIYNSPEMRDWFDTIIPGLASREDTLILDGDLPKADWFEQQRTPRLSEQDGEYHTVVPGRPIGLHPPDVAELAASGIHLHFYGDFTHGQWLGWIEKVKSLAGSYIHLHSQVDQENWVQEFSQYDAGWLHYFRSENQGEIQRANWDDLNYPARMATLAVCGLPMLQRRNPGAVVATQNLVQELDLGIFFEGMADLRRQLDDTARLEALQESVWRKRQKFMFDTHADRLVDFFRQVIRRAHSRVPAGGILGAGSLAPKTLRGELKRSE